MSLVTKIKRNDRIHHITATLQRSATNIGTAHTVTAGSCKTTKHKLECLLQKYFKSEYIILVGFIL
jgi:hypothetical protein